MRPQPLSLAQLQREMAAAVMAPLTPDEEMRSESSDGRPMAQVASSFIAPNSRLSPFERLEIYNRQYWFRILGALHEDFPALRGVVGSRTFDALAVAYLTAYPSRSFSLRNLGSRLPEWLTANPQFAGRRHRMAVDVARMEWAFVEAFDNAERDPLTLDQIAALDSDSRLALQPHLQLVELEYPVDDLVLALHKAEKRQASEAGQEHDDDSEATPRLPALRRQPTNARSSRHFAQFARASHLERPLRPGLPAHARPAPGVRNSCASGLPPGPNLVGSAGLNLKQRAHENSDGLHTFRGKPFVVTLCPVRVSQRRDNDNATANISDRGVDQPAHA